MTLDVLKEFGADTADGMARCLNNEAFYLKMVGMGIADGRFETLGSVLEVGKLDEAFEIAHALKGILGNLALTPIYTPISEMTEQLRAKNAGADYMGLYAEMKRQRDRLLAMSA